MGFCVEIIQFSSMITVREGELVHSGALPVTEGENL